MKAQMDTSKKIRQLEEVLRGKNSMLIVLQDNPDPDAIASAAALKALAKAIANMQCSIVHGGIVGRAENQAMVKYLDLNLHKMDDIDPARFDIIAMVDTQPQAGNNPLPRDIVPHIVIDHHPIRSVTRRSPFTDIRGKYGATSTILCEYLGAAKVDIDVKLATSLVYGIRSDTQDLGRETVQADIDAFLSLYPKANKRILSRIEWGQVPDVYFQLLVVALRNARIYDDCVITDFGVIDNPDMIGEVADLLLRRAGTVWVLCFGFYESGALFSLRTSDLNAVAGRVARKIAGRKGSGGGHTALAAGQIPLKKNTDLERRKTGKLIETRFLRILRRVQSESRHLVV